MQKIRPGYTRVSEVLSQWGMYSMIDKEVLEKKKELGLKVHSLIDSYLNMVPFIDPQPEEEGYFNSFLKWFDRCNPSVLCTENRFYSETLMVTGCVDAIFTMPWEERPIIVDWKTSSQPNHINWKLQSTFYMMLAKEDGSFPIADRALFIQLDKNGENPRIHEYEYKKNVVESCLSALNTYRYLKSEGFCFR